MVDNTNDLLNKLNIDGSISAKDFVHILLFENDASDIDEIRRKFKKNFLDKFKDILEKTTTKDIKKIFDPLNLTGLLRDSDEIREDFKKYKRKLKSFLKKANEELSSERKKTEEDNDNTSNKKESSDNNDTESNNNDVDLPDTSLFMPDDKQNISEQQEFGPKAIIVELGEKTNKFFIDLFENFKGDKLQNAKTASDQSSDQKKSGGGGGGLLDFLGYAIAAGLLVTFWESHIRPFLEEQFDFMGRLEGTFNAIEKGLYGFVTKFLAGGLNIGGMVFKTVGELAEGMLNGVVKMFTGGGGTKSLAEGGAKAVNFLPNVAKTVGQTILKAARFLPVIGGLISFGFAVDRFSKGDWIGGIIDFVGGLGSLIMIVPGGQVIGAALSWGALALNAVLDLSAEGNTEEEKGASKINKLKEWITAPVKWLKNIPFIKKLFSTFSGLGKLATGDFAGAAKDLKDGWFGGLADTFKLFGEDKSENVEIDQKYTPIKIDDEKKIEEFDKEEGVEEGRSYTMKQRQKYNKEFDKVYKIKENTTDENQLKEANEYLKFLEDQLKKIDETEAEIARKAAEASRSRKTKDSNLPYETDEEKYSTSNSWPIAKLDDGEISYNPELKIGNSTIAKFNPQDNFSITAAKPDGMFSEMNKMLGQQLENLNRQFSEIGKSLNSTGDTSNNSYVNVNNSNGGGGGSGFNDPVFRNRSLYLQQMRFA